VVGLRDDHDHRLSARSEASSHSRNLNPVAMARAYGHHLGDQGRRVDVLMDVPVELKVRLEGLYPYPRLDGLQCGAPLGHAHRVDVDVHAPGSVVLDDALVPPSLRPWDCLWFELLRTEIEPFRLEKELPTAEVPDMGSDVDV
ncbi:unnamed protein product, partial [Ectocarpus fasciculatus]